MIIRNYASFMIQRKKDLPLQMSFLVFIVNMTTICISLLTEILEIFFLSHK